MRVIAEAAGDSGVGVDPVFVRLGVVCAEACANFTVTKDAVG